MTSISKYVIRDEHGNIIAQSGFSVVGSVNVEVATDVGEPYAESSYENGVLNITLHNIKGEAITDITWTPSSEDAGANILTIKTDGGNTFEFPVLNGSKGDKGDKGDKGEKGAQGDSFQPIEDVSGLVLAHVPGQDNTKAMSQKGVTDAIWNSIINNAKAVDYTIANYRIISSTGKFGTNNARKHGYLSVKEGEQYIFRSLTDNDCCYAFATSNSSGSDATVPLVEDTTFHVVGNGEYEVLTIPAGCKYLLLSNDGEYSPTFEIKWEIMRFYGYDTINNIEQKFNEETEDITQQIEDLTNMRYYDFDETEIAKFPLGPYAQKSGVFGGANSSYASYHFSKDESIIMRGKHIKLTPQAGKNIRLFFFKTNEPKAKKTQIYSEILRNYLGEVDEVVDVIVPEDAEYVTFQQITGGVDIRPVRIEVYEKSSLEDLRKFTESIAKSIESDNTSTKAIIRQSLWVADDMEGKPFPLALLHFSDIHGTDEAAQRIQQYIEQFNGYTDDILCTGDSADYLSNKGNGKDWWVSQSGLAEKSLFVLGNHDGATEDATEYDTEDNGYAWDGQGQQWDYDNYFAPFIEGWGVTMPDGYDDSTSPYYKACYWHKDYPEQKVRLIGLDCMHRFDGIVDATTGAITSDGLKRPVSQQRPVPNDQELWLREKLNETLDSESDVYGWSVIVCCHYALDDMGSTPNKQWNDETHEWVYNQNNTGGAVRSYKTSAVVNFHKEDVTSIIQSNIYNLRNRIDNGYSTTKDWHDYVKGNVNNFGNIISEWIDNGGKFIAWLSGHSHRDYMFYPAKFPNMLNITIDQAGNINPSHSGDRSSNTESATCANFFVADTQNGLIKIVRLGFTMNKYLNSHRYICYDYINKKVISEG